MKVNLYRVFGYHPGRLGEDPLRVSEDIRAPTRREAVDLFCRRTRVKPDNILDVRFEASVRRDAGEILVGLLQLPTWFQEVLP